MFCLRDIREREREKERDRRQMRREEQRKLQMMVGGSQLQQTL